MEIIDLSFRNETGLPEVVATLGFFDGVHIGHRHLIEQVKAEANRLGLPSAVITFPVHPRKVLQADYQPKLLCGYEEKLGQLATTGIDYCIGLPFTTALSKLSASEFITQVLKEKIHVNTMLVGYDHRFGHNREEGLEEYVLYGKAVGMNIVQATEMRVDEEDVSSSRIRRLLMKGDIVKAKVISEKNQVFHLTTNDKGLGILYAFCSRDATLLVQDKYNLKCPKCGNIERRKMSPEYTRESL